MAEGRCEFVDSRLRRYPPDRASARSPMDKPGKTPCVSPRLPTGRRLPTSFTAPQQHQGLILIPGKVQPSAGDQPLAYFSRKLSRRPGPSHASGKRDDRPGLDACLKSLRKGDTLLTWKLDRIGRDLRHLVNLVHDLTTRSVGLRVLAGEGAAIDTTTANGRLMFGFFAALAEFERELIVERTKAGLASARARGRKGGRPFKMTAAKLRLAQAAMGQPGTKVRDLCTELGVSRQTLYRHVTPKGALRPDGLRLVARRRTSASSQPVLSEVPVGTMS